MNDYELKHPITEAEGREPVSVVKFRRPKVRDLRKINAVGKDGDEMDQAVAMIAACTYLTPAQIDELDAEDFTEVAGAGADFFPKEPEKTAT